jgi:hypothetical protein
MAEATPLKILLLAHDLSDDAIYRRTLMLRAGGALVTVAGFRRTEKAIASVAGCKAVDFGRTYNAGFAQRIGAVLRAIFSLKQHRELFAEADIVIARNLEMLAIAARGRRMRSPAPVLVYEMLDIHRFLLKRGPIGAVFRALEGWLARRVSAVITSSPAYIDGYFNALSKIRAPIRLVENKVLDLGDAPLAADPAPRMPGPPWKIGWFGMIRCQKSLRILSELARQSRGNVEIVIRGRPAPDLFPDFEKRIAGMPGLRFLGPYKPDDLAAIYRAVHFNWAIDMFEEGFNSAWLLPNRLYEGGLFGTVPLALDQVETGRFLKHLGIGVTIKEPLGENLAAFFRDLTAARYRALEDALRAMPRETWVSGKEDCRVLTAWLGSLRSIP